MVGRGREGGGARASEMTVCLIFAFPQTQSFSFFFLRVKISRWPREISKPVLWEPSSATFTPACSFQMQFYSMGHKNNYPVRKKKLKKSSPPRLIPFVCVGLRTLLTSAGHKTGGGPSEALARSPEMKAKGRHGSGDRWKRIKEEDELGASLDVGRVGEEWM